MTPFEAMRYRNGAVSASTLYSLIMADGPVNYWRNGEASGGGLGMIDEVQVPAQYGTYVGVISFSNPAIYPGGGAGTSITGFSNVKHGTSTAYPASLTAMSLIAVVKLNATSGNQPVGTQRDNNGGGGRKYQLRANGTSFEFVKIAGGVQTVTQAGVFTAGVACIIGFTVDASGNYAMYKNGAQIKTGSIAAANYGGAGDQYQIGYSTGMAGTLNGLTCENAVFNKVISGARIAAYATAAGL